MNKLPTLVKSIAIFCTLALAVVGTNGYANAEFQSVTAPRPFTFPRDHGAHPEFKTEWWYFTGHLQSDSGRTFGFELTFFRVGLTPIKGQEEQNSWRVSSLLIAHAAVTDDQGKRFLFHETLARPHFGIAGYSVESFDVWIKDWFARLDQKGGFALKAVSEEPGQSFAFNLNLSSQKSPVLNGDRGFSQKGAQPGDASYYITFTRLTGSGQLSIGGETFQVSAQAWMDHEFSSSKLTREILGWDWFAVQLSDGQEIMLYQLRDAAGKPTKFSSGTLVSPSGDNETLSSEDFSIEALQSWKSPATEITYPSRWLLRIPKRNVTLTVEPTVEAQELRTDRFTGVTYWEGRSRVTGTSQDQQVTGDAYVELVGYGKPHQEKKWQE